MRTSDVIGELMLAGSPARVLVAATGSSPEVRALIAGARRLEATVEFVGLEDIDDIGDEVQRLPAPGLVGLAAAHSPDLAFVSLDPNTYTTARALELLVLSSEVVEAEQPVLVVARATSERDVFVNVEAIPRAHRGDLSGETVDVDGRRGVLGSGGRGVRGAVEDFLALPDWHGWRVADSQFAVLVSDGRRRATPALDAALDQLSNEGVLVPWPPTSVGDPPRSLLELGQSLIEQQPGGPEPDIAVGAPEPRVEDVVEEPAADAADTPVLGLVARVLDDIREAAAQAGKAALLAREQADEAQRAEDRLRREVDQLEGRRHELARVVDEGERRALDPDAGRTVLSAPPGEHSLEEALSRAEEAQRRADRAAEERRRAESGERVTGLEPGPG